MPRTYEVSAIAANLADPRYVADLLGRLGCETRVATRGDLTVLAGRIRAASGIGAMAVFMRRLECAQVKFDHICPGGLEEALRAYPAPAESAAEEVGLALAA